MQSIIYADAVHRSIPPLMRVRSITLTLQYNTMKIAALVQILILQTTLVLAIPKSEPTRDVTYANGIERGDSKTECMSFDTAVFDFGEMVSKKKPTPNELLSNSQFPVAIYDLQGVQGWVLLLFNSGSHVWAKTNTHCEELQGRHTLEVRASRLRAAISTVAATCAGLWEQVAGGQCMNAGISGDIGSAAAQIDGSRVAIETFKDRACGAWIGTAIETVSGAVCVTNAGCNTLSGNTVIGAGVAFGSVKVRIHK